MGRRFIASNCVSAGLYLYCIVQRGWRLRCKSLFAANNIAFPRAPSILESAEEKRWMELWTLIRRKPGAMEACFRLCIFLCGIQINQSRAHTHAAYSSCDRHWHRDDNPSLSHQPCWRSTPPTHIPKSHHTHTHSSRENKTPLKELKAQTKHRHSGPPFSITDTPVLSYLIQLTFSREIDTSHN